MAAEYVVLIGSRIREAREAKGLTQAELAAKLPGKSDGTQISKWERGVHRPGDDTLEHIARATDRTVAWFLTAPPDKTETPDPFPADEPDLAALRDAMAKLDAKLDQVLTEVRNQPDFRQEIHSAFEDYASRLGERIGKLPPQSKRNPDPPAKESPAAA